MHTKSEAALANPSPECRSASRLDIERRLLRRESLFWRPWSSDGPTGGRGTGGRGDPIVRPDRRLQKVIRGLCLVTGERLVIVLRCRRDGQTLILTNYRLVELRTHAEDGPVLVPLSAVVNHDYRRGRIRFELADGRTLGCRIGSGLSAKRRLEALDRVMGRRMWQSLDAISLGLLFLSRSRLTRDLGFTVPKMIPFVPAVRRGGFRLGHESRKRILGVCAGIAASRCTSVARVRTLFLLSTLLFGLGIAAYLLLGLLMGINASRAGSPHRRYEDADLSGCATF